MTVESERIELPGGMYFVPVLSFKDGYSLVGPNGAHIGPQWWHGDEARAFTAALRGPAADGGAIARVERMALALDVILTGMEASGGWKGDDDLYKEGHAALQAYWAAPLPPAPAQAGVTDEIVWQFLVEMFGYRREGKFFEAKRALAAVWPAPADQRPAASVGEIPDEVRRLSEAAMPGEWKVAYEGRLNEEFSRACANFVRTRLSAEDRGRAADADPLADLVSHGWSVALAHPPADIAFLNRLREAIAHYIQEYPYPEYSSYRATDAILPIVAAALTSPAQALPEREQIAVAIFEADAPQLRGLWKQEPSGHRVTYYKFADAVLALLDGKEQSR